MTTNISTGDHLAITTTDGSKAIATFNSEGQFRIDFPGTGKGGVVFSVNADGVLTINPAGTFTNVEFTNLSLKGVNVKDLPQWPAGRSDEHEIVCDAEGNLYQKP